MRRSEDTSCISELEGPWKKKIHKASRVTGGSLVSPQWTAKESGEGVVEESQGVLKRVVRGVVTHRLEESGGCWGEVPWVLEGAGLAAGRGGRSMIGRAGGGGGLRWHQKSSPEGA